MTKRTREHKRREFVARARRLAAVLVIACWWTSSAAADTVISVEPAAPKLSVADGVLAWSNFDRATGAWFLTIRRGTLVQRLPVAPRAVPFDVDLGHDARGHLIAVYSRCDREPEFPPTGRGCDLYRYDLDAGFERRLAGASTDLASEYLPSLDGGRVAFARVYERRAGLAGRRAHLFVRRLDTGTERELPGGVRNADARTGPTGLDLSGRRLAFSWQVHGPAGTRFPYGASELRVDELDGRQTLVKRSAGSALNRAALLSPALVGTDLRYGETFVAEGTPRLNDLRSYDLASGRSGRAAVESLLAGVTADRGAIGYVSCAGAAEPVPVGPNCRVMLRDGGALADADRELLRLARPTTVSSYQGWTAFSAFDPPVSAYRLRLRSPAGALHDAGVAPRAVPFDVDLGPGPGGGLVAVYSRCRVEPRLDPRDRLPLPATGRGCDVYRQAVAGGRETKVPVASRSGASEFLPTVSGVRIAFARRVGDRAPALYAGRTAGGRLVHLSAGPRGARAGLGPRALDLRGRRLALAWEHARRGGGRVSEMRLDVIGGRGRTLARAVSRDGARRLLFAGFDGRMLSWVARHLPGQPPSAAVRYDVVRRSRQTLVLPDPATAFVPGPRDSALYGRTDGDGWSLRETDVLPQLLR